MHGKYIIAFCHIPKTAGMSWTRILRGYFGIRHLSVIRRKPPTEYTYEDMKFDLKIFPWIKSLAGHPLRPYIDYKEFSKRLIWYTFLREPWSRFLSQYQHEVEKGKKTESLEEWMEKYDRRNFQVRWIAGKEDLDLAKSILKKFHFVGRQDKYRLSIELLLNLLGLPSSLINYIKSINKMRNTQLRLEIDNNARKIKQKIMRYNELDFELWDWFKFNYWPNQVSRIAENNYNFENYENDVSLKRFKLSLIYSFLMRNVLYKPIVRIHSIFTSF